MVYHRILKRIQICIFNMIIAYMYRHTHIFFLRKRKYIKSKYNKNLLASCSAFPYT